jgi:hypothetical protein
MLKFLLLFLLVINSIFATDLNWVKEPDLVFDDKEKNWKISFEISQEYDVEVAIIDMGSNKILRHLAAGLLGKNPPQPLVANSKAQNLIWDGKNDFGVTISDFSKIAVQVRVGMSVNLKILWVATLTLFIQKKSVKEIMRHGASQV